MRLYIIEHVMQSSNSKKYIFPFAISLIGAAAVTSQILLVREIVNLFSGNELLYGLTIFLWLILYSAGSGLLGRLGHKIKNRLFAFIFLQSTIILLLPIEIFLARIAKDIFGIPFGMLVDLWTSAFIIFMLLAPITLILGFQFALGSLLLTDFLRKDAAQIIQVYIFESVGSILGGLILAYILIFFLNAFQIAAILAALISLSFALLGRTLSRKNILFFGSALLLLALTIFVSAPYLDHYSTQKSLKDYRLIEAADSPYGRIIISEYQGSYNFYENGGLLFATADELDNEETAHLSLLLHPDPRNILLIGGAVTGITQEILKYPIQGLDCVELDYKLIELAKKIVRIDPAVNILTVDGVKYVSETDKKYDIILINLPDPTTALINRFYTLEFFKMCKEKLVKGGILTFNLETSGSYLGRELKLLNRSIYKTVARAFKYTSVIPGNYNYFFASDSELNDVRAELLKRWEKRNIRTNFFRSDSLYFILWPDKVGYVREAVKYDDATPLNTEFNPISYFYGLLIWASYFYSPLKDIFYALLNVKFPALLLILTAIVISIKLISLKIRRLILPAIISLLGFAGMCVQIIIIYAFQSLYGYVYQTIGLLTTLFMAGLAAGSFLVYANYPKFQNPLKNLKDVIWLLLLNIAMIFMLLKSFPLPLASFLVALPIGAAFPLAVKIHEKYRSEIGSLAGILYGSDLLGGALAAIVTTIVFIPLFGILNTFLVAMLLTAAALVMAYS